MSKELPGSQPSEEVDLAKLFKFIGDLINRFFGLMSSFFNKLFLALIWVVLFVKKHTIKILISGALGVAYGVYKEKTSDPIYKSHVTIKQNYRIGEDLYNSIGYFNDLLTQNDTLQLGSVLGIKPEQASVILSFDIQSVVSENARLKEFNDYLKTLDTAVASKVNYEDFLLRYIESDYQFQKITITAKEKNNFNLVFKKIIEWLNSNQYFVSEQAKDLSELKRKKEALEEALLNSQSLQTTYKRILENNLGGKSSEIGITFEGNSNNDKTKEYDLYLNDIKLRQELVEIESEKADLDKIVEIISGTQDTGSVYNSKHLLGLSMSAKAFYGLCLMGLTFLIVLVLQVLKFLEQYKSKN